MFEITYEKANDVLWRSGPDRVLVRRVGHDGHDLLGVAAFVWLALETPRSIAELALEASSLLDGPVDMQATVDALVAEHLVVASDGPLATGGHDR